MRNAAARRLTIIGALGAALALLGGADAQAHVEAGHAAGFLSGLEHPVSGLDHVLAMVSVGIWGAQLGPPALWLLPVMFPVVMALGGFLGLIGVPLPGVEIGIAASAVALGAAILLEWRPSLAAALLAVSAFAVFHGHAHGTELPPGASGLLYSLGFVAATGCLHALGIGAGLAHRWGWGRKALQGTGAAVAMGGMFFLWRAFA
jgi:urease accessory protein